MMYIIVTLGILGILCVLFLLLALHFYTKYRQRGIDLIDARHKNRVLKKRVQHLQELAELDRAIAAQKLENMIEQRDRWRKIAAEMDQARLRMVEERKHDN